MLEDSRQISTFWNLPSHATIFRNIIVCYCFAGHLVYLRPWHLDTAKIKIQTVDVKGAVSRQSSSFCLVFPITRP